MIRTPSCSSCGRPLKPHCHVDGDPTYTPCTWWRCPDLTCPVSIHDFTRGVRILRNGHRERFMADG